MAEPRRKSVFEVDKRGLAKVLERRGKHFAITELIQNAWDEDGVSRVDVKLTTDLSRRGRFELIVEDDAPEGFADLHHAYTLFAESKKKGRADQRGRFNLGEKFVIAICDWVQLATTKGLVEFTDEGRREFLTKRDHGTKFHAILRMTVAEAKATEAVVETLIPPPGITTTFNGREVGERVPLVEFETTLRTELADTDGYLHPTRRKTKVAVYATREGEVASLYEMGIPVVEVGDKWHVDIGQKVPLTTDRDNVPPGFLRDVRTAVLNNTTHLIDPDIAGEKWIDDALESKDVTPQAVTAVVTERYGDKRVVDDPSDREGTKIAVSQGYAVIPAGAFSKSAWANVRESKAALPAGQVTPSPNPHEGEDALDLMDPAHYPEGVKVVVAYAEMLAQRLLGVESITVRVCRDPQWRWLATYGARGGRGGQLTLGYGRLGYKFFASGRTEAVDALLLHEFGHHRVADHLSAEFADEVARLAAKLIQLALDDPATLCAHEIRTAVAA